MGPDQHSSTYGVNIVGIHVSDMTNDILTEKTQIPQIYKSMISICKGDNQQSNDHKLIVLVQ